jgi:hypothetical protein
MRFEMADAQIAQFKTCTKCGHSKPTDRFTKDKTRSDGLFSWCRECKSAAAKAHYRSNPAPHIERAARKRAEDPEAMRLWRERNAAHVQSYNRKHYARNREERRAYHARYAKEKAVERREYRRKNVERAREANRRRRRSPKGKLDGTMSRGINRSLKGGKAGRSWEALVGYSVVELMAHIERQFLPGMTWDNHGTFGWHIDHIVPLRAFNFADPDHIDFSRAWALSNLRPLWWRDNLTKQGKIESPFQPSLAI